MVISSVTADHILYCQYRQYSKCISNNTENQWDYYSGWYRFSPVDSIGLLGKTDALDWKNRCPWPPVARVDWQFQINGKCLLLCYVGQIQSYWRKVVNASVSSKHYWNNSSLYSSQFTRARIRLIYSTSSQLCSDIKHVETVWIWTLYEVVFQTNSPVPTYLLYISYYVSVDYW